MEKAGAMDQFAVVNPGFIDCLLRWIVYTQQPLSVVEQPTFLALVSSLNGRTNVPNRKAITDRLQEIELQVRAAVCILVCGMYVACTTDAWTSIANEAFCSLTLHWITKSFEQISIALDCSAFPGSHTGEAVAAKLNELLRIEEQA